MTANESAARDVHLVHTSLLRMGEHNTTEPTLTKKETVHSKP